ncbi:MAG: SusC/RagA family TonB-linked outer membrane protein [Saprospiraceae bacterium]|nr:SusC/RagA family TonB-linked outer membrane protein [Saprospiraceae bacterium]
MLLVIIFGFKASAQSVSGTVTDDTGSALIGVTVLIQKSGTGTITDLDGRYKINANPGQVLEFSMVGMETKAVTVGASNTIDVILSGSILLESIEIVGAMGIVQDKRKLAYSAQGVSGVELLNTQRDNAFVALGSRIAGLSLTPTSGLAGGSVNINLRGVNSIGNSNQPLLVMDGLPVSSSTFSTKTLFSDATGVNANVNNNRDDVGSRLAEINPNDIESITVLKGPEAAALYGNEGANGVIIITTKKGKAGSSRISYSNRFTTSELYRFNEVQQVYGRGKNGGIDVNDPDYFGPKYADSTQFYNNVENFFQKGSSMRHDLALEGGADGFTYRLSGAYLKNKGNIPTNEYNQLNLAANSEIELNSWLKASSRFSISQNKNILPPGGTQGYLLGTLRYPTNFDMQNYLTPEGNRTLTLPNSTYGTDSENAFFDVNKNIRTESTNRTVGNVALIADITKNWNITGRMGSDIYTTSANRFFHPQSNIGFAKSGWIENYIDHGRILNGTFLNTVKTKLGNSISATLLLGTSVDDRRNEISNDYGEKLYLPDYNSINNTDPITQRNRPTILRSRLIGLFGEAKFGYNEWLFLNVSGRNDWSSTLPIQNRSYFYPSAGLAINFTDIPSLQGSFGPLNFGKIRFSYANVGNPAKPYAVRSRLVSQTSTGGGFLYDFYGDNPNLKPENVVSYEIGTELGFFNDRLTLDLALYSKSITDQIVTQRLSYGTGFIFGLLNGGDLNTKGMDIQVGIVPVKSENFMWKINANFTKYKTVVNNLPANVNEYYDSDTWVYGNVRSAGFAPADVLAARLNKPGSAPFFYSDLNSRGAGSATAISGLSYQRNSKGDILINPTTGFPISNPNFLPIGDRVPDFTIGLANDFTFFKNFNLSFLLDIRKGGDIFNGNEMYLTQIGLSKKTINRDEPIVVTGVLKDGKEETETPTPNTKEIIPSANELYYTTVLQPEDFIERDINWLRLRDVTLRYQIPTTVFKNVKVIRDASVFINGTDLFLITNYTGADPYVSATNSATGGAGGFGMDFGKTSLPRTFSAGLSVTF